MSSYVLVKVANNFYCYNVHNVQRVIDFPKITALPDTPSYIEGMMNYAIDSSKTTAIKVINFRVLISQHKLHYVLMNSLKNDFFNDDSYEVFSKIYPKLTSYKEISYHLNIVLNSIKSKNISVLTSIQPSVEFIQLHMHHIANKYQKCIVLDEGNDLFALCVDEIIKVLHFEDNLIHKKNTNDNHPLQIKGIIEIEDKLIYVIDNISIQRGKPNE